MKVTFKRPSAALVVVTTSFLLATAGLLILAFDDTLYDEWAIVGASGATIIALVCIALTRSPVYWLVVGAAWVYAAVIELLRAPNGYAKVGLSLIFLALAFGALGAYTGYRREEVGEEVKL